VISLDRDALLFNNEQAALLRLRFDLIPIVPSSSYNHREIAAGVFLIPIC
jgi:hypothetical protein